MKQLLFFLKVLNFVKQNEGDNLVEMRLRTTRIHPDNLNLKPANIMTTIKISVRNKRDANLLYRMLKRIPFIDRVEKEDTLDKEKNTGQFEKIKNLMATMAGPELFKQIPNPVTWQQDLRNEWE